MSSLSDQDAQSRQRIISRLDCNLLVQAAAGTGKTTAIVSRMLQMIQLGVCSGGHMAAVTFTRKAAAELRERFSYQLRERLRQLDAQADALSDQQQLQRERLSSAAEASGQLFIDTIHSFCATLLRARPIEFGIDPALVELDAVQELRLRNQAWEQNLAELTAQRDPLPGQLTAHGLRVSQLRSCFDDLLEYRDISHWPMASVPDWDEAHTRQQTAEYVAHLQELCQAFVEPVRDELMERLELIARSSTRSLTSRDRFFNFLELFDRSPKLTQKRWPQKQGKLEDARYQRFRDEVARPALSYWRQTRYQWVMMFVRRAVEVYQRLKAAQSGVDYTDLLLITAHGLRTQPHLRRYCQRMFSHLLVDEFQDTDPLQAEIVALLASEDSQDGHPCDWQTCRLRPGSLFIVGDPKQSIYRFRRGDIVTYNRIKDLFEQSGGEVLTLSRNFRSSPALLAWNNQVFEQLFGQGNDVSPEHTPMFAGHASTTDSQLSGLFKLSITKGMEIEDEAERVASFIDGAIRQQLTVSQFEAARGQWITRPVTAGDFLIIARTKGRLHHFKSAIERRGVPCDVAGSNALSALEELRTLLVVLYATDDPYNPLPYLDLLRGRLFGLSDAELYEFKRAGGVFQFSAPLPEKLAEPLRLRMASIQQCLTEYQLALRTLPPAAAVSTIMTRVGLIAHAAAQAEGQVALGTLLKALEMLRNLSWQFDSAADLISGLEQLLEQDEIEGISARPPASSAVRIMNLHKAKGLEASIVLLVNCSDKKAFAPRHYIARDSSQAQGYMWICEKQGEHNHLRPIAEPGGWKELSAIESRFQAAEEDRLLYVATTRAAHMLVVCRGPERSHWSRLYPFLENAPELPAAWSLAPVASNHPSVEGANTWSAVDSIAIAQHAPEGLWQQAMRPTYRMLSIKHEALRGRKRPAWQSGSEYGAAWGTAIHQLLDLASRSTLLNIDGHALSIALENGIQRADVDELAQTVRSVLRSEIWQRSSQAIQRLSEVPIDAWQIVDGLPTMVRGVIDLVFQEPDGWVIVDYKSDNIERQEAANTYEYYRVQLEQYAHYWQQLTGQPVKQSGIYLTRLNTFYP